MSSLLLIEPEFHLNFDFNSRHDIFLHFHRELGEDSIFISSYVTENLTLAGEYSADGSIGLMCMRGSGPFSIRFGKMTNES